MDTADNAKVCGRKTGQEEGVEELKLCASSLNPPTLSLAWPTPSPSNALVCQEAAIHSIADRAQLPRPQTAGSETLRKETSGLHW